MNETKKYKSQYNSTKIELDEMFNAFDNIVCINILDKFNAKDMNEYKTVVNELLDVLEKHNLIDSKLREIEYNDSIEDREDFIRYCEELEAEEE